ncbi:MAG: hypothetical protein GEU79_02330, partial [Acidimicrobiia bacterium]|nr:hypothetical protein [Acidimicrobiia bacterium]
MGVGIPDPTLGQHTYLRQRSSIAMPARRPIGWFLAFGLLVVMFLVIPGHASADPVAEQPGFYVEDVFGGYQPESSITAIRFAPDGRAFVAERRGRILVFDSISDTTPDVIDLTNQVHGFWDRGLLGLAVDPDFPAEPWIYVFYTRDGSWQGQIWGDLISGNDSCPDPPGQTADGCVVMGRLSRMTIDANNNEGPEQPILDGKWCFQFPSHSADDLVFGPDGMLYVSAGDGASFGPVDYGQHGGTQGSPPVVPQNPCADPFDPEAEDPAVTGEGGMLRSQDIRTSGDPLGYNGAVVLIAPETGDAQMLAHGLRNPYRMAFGPDGALFVGDVGWGIWEE